MADTILIRAGTKAKMPVLLYRELGYCHDTKELYIGSGAGNILVGKVDWETDISSLKSSVRDVETAIEGIETDIDGKLTAVQANAVSQLGAEADVAAVITSFNSLIASLQTAGIMKT